MYRNVKVGKNGMIAKDATLLRSNYQKAKNHNTLGSEAQFTDPEL